MKRCKITIFKTTIHENLARQYAGAGFTKCPMMHEGQVFYADYAKPAGLCHEAWKAAHHYVDPPPPGAGQALIQPASGGGQTSAWRKVKYLAAR